MRQTISVITPAHPARALNGKLARAQASVLSQTLLPDAHIIAMDIDGQGAAATRQRALMMTQTDWIAPLDSDDLFLPKHLQWLMRHAQETGADYVYAWYKLLQEFPDGRQVVREDDPIFPAGHYLNDFNPDDPIETTVTVLIRTELAKAVGYHELDRGEANSGEDFGMLMGCVKAGAKIVHLRRKSWLWGHAFYEDGTMMNTSGRPDRGDAVRGQR